MLARNCCFSAKTRDILFRVPWQFVLEDFSYCQYFGQIRYSNGEEKESEASPFFFDPSSQVENREGSRERDRTRGTGIGSEVIPRVYFPSRLGLCNRDDCVRPLRPTLNIISKQEISYFYDVSLKTHLALRFHDNIFRDTPSPSLSLCFSFASLLATLSGFTS